MTTPVLIDCDPGIDDAVALALVGHVPELSTVAVTTTHGNTDVGRATRNARVVARRAGLSAPVIAGAARPLVRAARPARETHGPEGLGYHIPNEPAILEADRAATAIVAAARDNARLTLCCLGPLTNLAAALRSAPELCDRLGPVFVMGGAIAVRGTMTRWSEFNWWADPEAVEIVLRSGLDIRLVPLDVTRRIAVPGAAIRSLREAGRADEHARFWADALGFYAQFHRSYESFDGCIINDPLAVALAANPSLATWHAMRIGVSLSDDERRGAIVLGAPDGCMAQVARDVRAGDVLALIGRRVLSPWVAEDVLRSGAAAAERWLSENPLE